MLHDAYVDYLDWTYKVDRSKPFKIKPMSELNGRYFEYKYQSDADYYNDQYTKKYVENYADYIEDTGYEFAKEKQTAQLIFASTPIVGYLGKEKVYSTMNKLNGVIEEQIDTKIRILQAKKLTGYTNYDILNVATILSTQDYIGYAGHLDDPDNPESWKKAIRPNTKALFGETIANPKNDILDIETVAKIAHDFGVPLIVDNTVATPFLIRPIDFGADVVVHSVTNLS